jgi:hypothetical protein
VSTPLLDRRRNPAQPAVVQKATDRVPSYTGAVFARFTLALHDPSDHPAAGASP